MELHITKLNKDYEFVKNIRKGAYTDVTLCINRNTEKEHIIKSTEFRNDNDTFKYHIFSESLITLLVKNINCLSISKTIYITENKFNYVYDYYKSCLGDILYKEKFQKMSLQKKKKIMFNIAIGVKNLHDSHMIHCDIKPHNIVLDDENKVALIDYNISVLKKNNDSIIIDELQTVDYRSPECLFYKNHKNKLDYSQDIWALGMVFICILGYKNIFTMNESMNKIIMAELYGHENLKKIFINSNVSETIPFHNIPYFFPDIPDIINSMILLDPMKRPTIIDVLNDKYFLDIDIDMTHVIRNEVSEENILIELKNIDVFYDCIKKFSEIFFVIFEDITFSNYFFCSLNIIYFIIQNEKINNYENLIEMNKSILIYNSIHLSLKILQASNTHIQIFYEYLESKSLRYVISEIKFFLILKGRLINNNLITNLYLKYQDDINKKSITFILFTMYHNLLFQKFDISIFLSIKKYIDNNEIDNNMNSILKNIKKIDKKYIPNCFKEEYENFKK